MKHIKLFEEIRLYSLDDKLKLKDLCESYLSYLIDDGFIIRVKQTDNLRKSIEITITKGMEIHPNTRENFSWMETKDHIIPLVLNLQRIYYIEKVVFLSPDDFNTIPGSSLDLSITEERLDRQHLEVISYIDICLGEEKTT
jgi:hypothetical protein